VEGNVIEWISGLTRAGVWPASGVLAVEDVAVVATIDGNLLVDDLAVGGEAIWLGEPKPFEGRKELQEGRGVLALGQRCHFLHHHDQTQARGAK
jgi:hypothetical protein